jgi:parallel beta-helix repeat protein
MNFQGYGFDPHGQKKTGTYGDVLVIKNCLSTHNNWDGFTLDQTKNIYMFNCTARSNGRHGFNVVTGSRYVVIENSTSFVDGYYFPTGSGCGVQIQNNQGYPTQRVTIRNMLIIDPKKGGICIEGVSNVIATNNKIYGKTCFRIDTTVNVTVSNNTCYNSNPSTRFVMNSKNTNITISNTRNLTDSISSYSGQNLTIIVGYSNAASLKVRRGRDAYYVLQQAFDEIKANGRGKLFIEEGEYILSSFLEVGDNVSVIGAGLNKTVLKLQDFARPWWIPGTGTRRSGFLRSTWCNNLNFYNLTVDGNKNNQNTDKYSKYGRFGFFTEACDNVYVNGMGIVNFQGYGFDPHGVKRSKTWSVNLTIVNSYAGNNDWDGYTIDQSANVIIRNNIAYNNGRHGFNIVTGTYNIIIENNNAYGNGYYYYDGSEGCGIAVQNNMKYGTHNVTVKNNTFINSMDAGICVNDVYNVIVINNTIIRNNTIVCVKSVKVVNGTFDNNVCLPIRIPSPKPSPPSKSPNNLAPKRKNNGIMTKTSTSLLIICMIAGFIM